MADLATLQDGRTPAGIGALPLRQRGHWLVAVGPPDALRRVVESSGLHRQAWGPARDVVLAGDQWGTGGGRSAAVRGQLRWVGESWSAPAGWPERIASSGWPWPHGDPLDGTTGDAAVAVLDGEGRGVAVADHLGLAGLYCGRGGGVHVVATRPGLVADALAATGVRVERDPMVGAWHAYSGTLVAEAASYRGVERLHPGSRVVVGPGSLRVDVRLPWRDPAGLAGLTADELVDAAEEAVADHLRAALALDDDRPVLDLTGGKDSRTVLAVALRRFGLDAFRVRTVGPPAAAEVAAAAHIAAHLGFAHESGVTLRSRHGTYGDRARRFVDATDGMHTAWWMVDLHDDPAEVRVSGTSGELARTVSIEDAWLASGRPGGLTVGAVGDFVVERYRRGSGGFLRPEAEVEIEARIRGRLDLLASLGVPVDELPYAHITGYHTFYLAGLRLDREPDHRIRPLTDITVVRAAHASGLAGRRDELVHLGLVTRASPLLAALPLVPDAWRAPGTLPEVPALPVTAPQPAAAGASGHSTLGLGAARPDDERRRFIVDAFSDPDSGIWEVADRARVLDAVERFDELGMKPRQQLYGLATGAVWLAGG